MVIALLEQRNTQGPLRVGPIHELTVRFGDGQHLPVALDRSVGIAAQFVCETEHHQNPDVLRKVMFRIEDRECTLQMRAGLDQITAVQSEKAGGVIGAGIQERVVRALDQGFALLDQLSPGSQIALQFGENTVGIEGVDPVIAGGERMHEHTSEPVAAFVEQPPCQPVRKQRGGHP